MKRKWLLTILCILRFNSAAYGESCLQHHERKAMNKQILGYLTLIFGVGAAYLEEAEDHRRVANLLKSAIKLARRDSAPEFEHYYSKLKSDYPESELTEKQVASVLYKIGRAPHKFVFCEREFFLENSPSHIFSQGTLAAYEEAKSDFLRLLNTRK